MIDQHDDIGRLAVRYADVVQRIAKEHRVRQSTARRWFEEMVRFLDLCASSSSELAPSRKVDKAWHEFILFTSSYADFCERRYGRFLHHNPTGRPDPEAYERTVVAYTARYGMPSRRLWPAPGGVGAGSGGGCGGFFGSGGGNDGGGSSCGGGGCGGGGS